MGCSSSVSKSGPANQVVETTKNDSVGKTAATDSKAPPPLLPSNDNKSQGSKTVDRHSELSSVNSNNKMVKNNNENSNGNRGVSVNVSKDPSKAIETVEQQTPQKRNSEDNRVPISKPVMNQSRAVESTEETRSVAPATATFVASTPSWVVPSSKAIPLPSVSATTSGSSSQPIRAIPIPPPPKTNTPISDTNRKEVRADGSWHCNLCNFENSNLAYSCIVCGTEGNHAISDKLGAINVSQQR
jgi:hypothetical protein